MGSWIAFQEYIGLQIWGERFDPDWVVVMDGFNDAVVGCGQSQGVGNPMYWATMRTFVHGYMFSSANSKFYRSWIENELIKYRATYRAITGKSYILYDALFDSDNNDRNLARRQIIPTKVGEAEKPVEC